MKMLSKKSPCPISLPRIRAFLLSGAVCLALAGMGLTSCEKPPVPRTNTEVQTDQKLADQVKAEFGKSPSFKFPDVEVSTFKATVQLSGFVVSEDQKKAAEEIARNISGVKKVENRISLKN